MSAAPQEVDGWCLQRTNGGRPFGVQRYGETGRWVVVDRLGACALTGPDGAVSVASEEHALKLAGLANTGVLRLCP